MKLGNVPRKLGNKVGQQSWATSEGSCATRVAQQVEQRGGGVAQSLRNKLRNKAPKLGNNVGQQLGNAAEMLRNKVGQRVGQLGTADGQQVGQEVGQ